MDTYDRHCDLIELNHFYDARGSIVYDQVIFWELMGNRKYKVMDWMLVNNKDNDFDGADYPVKTNNIYICHCLKTINSKKIHFLVRSDNFRESWSQEDPERIDKKFHSEDERNLIFVIKAIKKNGEDNK